MSKTLQVIDPFFTMNIGDTFELSKDGKSYIAQHNEEFHRNTDDGDLDAVYSSSFEISPKWAKELIKDGFLVETEKIENKNVDKAAFVNVFDEIDNLLSGYKNELGSINETMVNEPECLRVEKTTVLSNIIKVLEHLKSLRK